MLYFIIKCSFTSHSFRIRNDFFQIQIRIHNTARPVPVFRYVAKWAGSQDHLLSKLAESQDPDLCQKGMDA